MKKILLIDDDSIVLNSVAKLLKKKGFEVQVAKDGSEAVEIFDKNFYSLIIVDIRMPGLNGVETIEALRSKNKRMGGNSFKEIVVTGYSEKRHIDECKRLKVCHIVFKPFDVVEFIDLVTKELL